MVVDVSPTIHLDTPSHDSPRVSPVSAASESSASALQLSLVEDVSTRRGLMMSSLMTRGFANFLSAHQAYQAASSAMETAYARDGALVTPETSPAVLSDVSDEDLPQLDCSPISPP